MNRDRLSAIAHRRHPVAAPLSDATVDRLLDRVAERQPHTVLDAGCGSAQWLVRLLERTPGATGVGVDLSADAVAAAVAFAAGRGVRDRVEIRQQDAGAVGDDGYDALLCIGSTHAFGGFPQTLRTLHTMASPGAYSLVGDGFWQRAPEQPTLDALEATADEFPSYAELVALVEAAGWAPVHVHVSTDEEWDDYEWSWIASLSEWAREHPEDPDSADAAGFAQRHRDEWLHGYRGTLGFAVVTAEKLEA
jgi:cyclopropane fatty-acyl-phospholipid synthase-like methyltransferase